MEVVPSIYSQSPERCPPSLTQHRAGDWNNLRLKRCHKRGAAGRGGCGSSRGWRVLGEDAAGQQVADAGVVSGSSTCSLVRYHNGVDL
jgi:hypothetical protein